MIDPLVDLDELQRARSDLEQVVVDADSLTLEGGIDDRLELVFDFRERAGLASASTTAALRRP